MYRGCGANLCCWLFELDAFKGVETLLCDDAKGVDVDYNRGGQNLKCISPVRRTAKVAVLSCLPCLGFAYTL